MIRSILGFVVKVAIFLTLGNAVFQKLHHHVKYTALKAVHDSLHSKNNLETFTARMTGQKSWLDTPPQKNILRGIGNWN